jgi:hypothetical protein
LFSNKASIDAGNVSAYIWVNVTFWVGWIPYKNPVNVVPPANGPVLGVAPNSLTIKVGSVASTLEPSINATPYPIGPTISPVSSIAANFFVYNRKHGSAEMDLRRDAGRLLGVRWSAGGCEAGASEQG